MLRLLTHVLGRVGAKRAVRGPRAHPGRRAWPTLEFLEGRVLRDAAGLSALAVLATPPEPITQACLLSGICGDISGCAACLTGGPVNGQAVVSADADGPMVALRHATDAAERAAVGGQDHPCLPGEPGALPDDGMVAQFVYGRWGRSWGFEDDAPVPPLAPGHDRRGELGGSGIDVAPSGHRSDRLEHRSGDPLHGVPGDEGYVLVAWAWAQMQSRDSPTEKTTDSASPLSGRPRLGIPGQG